MLSRAAFLNMIILKMFLFKERPHGGNLPPGTEKARDKLPRLVGMNGRTLEKAPQVRLSYLTADHS